MANWFALTTDVSLKEYTEPKKNIKCIYWIKKIDTDKINTTSYGNSYHIYRYEFYNSNLVETTLELNQWQIVEIRDPDGKCAYTALVIKISDPNGEIRTFNSGKQSSNIISAYNFLIEISKYETWRYYDLHKKINDLDDSINKLNEKNEKLSHEIAVFQETDFYYKLMESVESIRKRKVSNKDEKIISICRELGLNENFYESWIKYEYTYFLTKRSKAF